MEKIIKLFEQKGVFGTAKENSLEMSELSKETLIDVIAELGYLLEDNENHRMEKGQFEELKNRLLEI